MIEKALRNAITQAIPNMKIYPTNAPENVKEPYLVYMRTRTDKAKTLDGYTDKQALSFMFSIMATKYADMVDTRKQIEDLLLSLPKTQIDGIHIGDIDINNIDEQYEHELKVNRGIIDFTIYF
jgi:hypothetical protein